MGLPDLASFSTELSDKRISYVGQSPLSGETKAVKASTENHKGMMITALLSKLSFMAEPHWPRDVPTHRDQNLLISNSNQEHSQELT